MPKIFNSNDAGLAEAIADRDRDAGDAEEFDAAAVADRVARGAFASRLTIYDSDGAA